MMRVMPAFACLSVLTACGPVSLAQAERQCLERARLTQQPHSNVFVGVGSNGQTRLKGDITITSDYLQGRDPSAVYDACVYQKSGLPPSQPLYTRTDWKG